MRQNGKVPLHTLEDGQKFIDWKGATGTLESRTVCAAYVKLDAREVTEFETSEGKTVRFERTHRTSWCLNTPVTPLDEEE